MIQLETIKENELKELAEMADKIWKVHYVPIIGMEQVTYMLEKFYSFEALKNQISDGQKFYFILDGNLKKGFVSISRTAENTWFINKFYILPEHQSGNIGTEVMRKILSTMLSKNPNQDFNIRLTVNRQNFKAINFYFKNGFKIEKIEDFNIGNGYFMNDFIMIKNVTISGNDQF